MRMMGAPPCPKDYSEPKWANLLFGGSNCQVCDFQYDFQNPYSYDSNFHIRVVGHEEFLASTLVCVGGYVSDVPKICM